MSKNLNRFKKKYRNEIVAYGLLAYPLLHWSVFFLYPFMKSVYLSFTDWDLLSEPNLIKFKNYINLFQDDVFLKALGNTLIWTLVTTLVTILLALLCALLLENIRRGAGILRALIYWPCLIGAVATATVQKKVFSSSPYGLANKVVKFFGGSTIAWLDNPDIALWSLMILPIFFGFGTAMIIFIAGISQIPDTFYEAAEVDGAGKAKQFMSITLPLLKPIIFLNVILEMIKGFRILTPMQLVTDGGPFYNTSSVVLRIFKSGFRDYKMGYASAMAVFLFLIVLAITIIQMKVQKTEGIYD